MPLLISIKKIIKKTTQVSVSCLGLGLGLFVSLPQISSPATAQSSVTFSGGQCVETNWLNCVRYVLCPRNFKASSRNNGLVCRKVSNVKPNQNPICGRANGRNDWVFDGQQCMRKRATGRIIFATKNIQCPSGMNLIDGKCRDQIWGVVSLSPRANSSAAVKLSSSSRSATRRLNCDAGYRIERHSDGHYVCRQPVSAKSVNPQCKDFGGFNYNWVERVGQCGRRRLSGKLVFRDGLLYCKPGFSYSSSAKKCVRPGGGLYVSPKLIR